MRIIPDITRHIENSPDLTLTIGSFDGIHLGHRRILERLVKKAHARGGEAGLMTLRPHPRAFFSPDDAPARLTNDAQQQRLLAEAGLDALFVLPFDKSVASLDCQDFLDDIVLQRCAAKHLVVGHDFVFGSKAKGNYDFLVEQAAKGIFTVDQAEPLEINGHRVSSTLIRDLILQGKVDEVPTYLGRHYSICGEVVRGHNKGTALGYPTANILPGDYTRPARGVYAVDVRVDDASFPAATNIGIAPTVRNKDEYIEAHLLDFSGDLRGKEVEFIFHKRIRPEKRFANIEELKAAIADDITRIRAYFKT